MVYYVNYSSVYAIGIIFPVICTTATFLRFTARRSVDLRFGLDDWVSVSSLVGTLGCGAIMIYGAATGALGWNPPDGFELVPGTAPSPELAELYVKTQKLKYPLLLLSVVTIALIRLTFVLLYNRIFRFKRFELVCWIAAAIIISWGVAFFFALLFTCGTHFEANWGSTADLTKYCGGEFAMDNAMAISDAVIDIAILLMPIIPTCKLQMSAWRKFLVLIVFSLGIFSIAASLTRSVLSVELSNFKYGSPGKLFGIEAMANPIGIVSTVLWWTYMEIGLGCFVSNLPPSIGLVRGHGRAMLQVVRSKLSTRGSQTSSTVELGMSQTTGKSRDAYDLNISTTRTTSDESF